MVLVKLKLQMNIIQSDLSRILKICNHEAGHFVVASENRFKTNIISVLFNFQNGHSGESDIEPWNPLIKTISDVKNYIKR